MSQSDDTRMKHMEEDIHSLKLAVDEIRRPNYQLLGLFVAVMVPFTAWIASNFVTDSEMKDAQLKQSERDTEIRLSIAELKMLILSSDYRDKARDDIRQQSKGK